eukprot:CAMPEP_0184321776 /NCGR_PEP_ID=MMETSP1049-20130417/121001_1 /TAXON_ID=77928 /ORGANISM="Proteomonas sulcata, Strain CCMP704" /LENGTH=59 /DNA_ID=CAMNT_0026642711 /DNA_START=71 /DNA_END=250 /DNA_ORIENTATION=-
MATQSNNGDVSQVEVKLAYMVSLAFAMGFIWNNNYVYFQSQRRKFLRGQKGAPGPQAAS